MSNRKPKRWKLPTSDLERLGSLAEATLMWSTWPRSVGSWTQLVMLVLASHQAHQSNHFSCCFMFCLSSFDMPFLICFLMCKLRRLSASKGSFSTAALSQALDVHLWALMELKTLGFLKIGPPMPFRKVTNSESSDLYVSILQ